MIFAHIENVMVSFSHIAFAFVLLVFVHSKCIISFAAWMLRSCGSIYCQPYSTISYIYNNHCVDDRQRRIWLKRALVNTVCLKAFEKSAYWLRCITRAAKNTYRDRRIWWWYLCTLNFIFFLHSCHGFIRSFIYSLSLMLAFSGNSHAIMEHPACTIMMIIMS